MDPTRDSMPSNRVPLMLTVDYRKSYSRSEDHGVLKNISMSGAFLEHCNDKLKARDKISITFQVGGRVRMVIASVIWSNQKGAGIKFFPANNRDVQIVDDLIYYVQNQRESRRSILASIFKQVS